MLLLKLFKTFVFLFLGLFFRFFSLESAFKTMCVCFSTCLMFNLNYNKYLDAQISYMFSLFTKNVINAIALAILTVAT